MEPAVLEHSGGGHLGVPQQPGTLQIRPAMLCPPSYFTAAPCSGEGGSEEEPIPVARRRPTSTTLPSPLFSPRETATFPAARGEVERGEHKQAAAPRLENQALGREIQTPYQPPHPTPPPPHLPTTARTSHPHLTPCLLTSDLLQVESQLQSRLTMVEGERRRLARQVESLERALQEAREQHMVELETLTSQHRLAAEALQQERRRMEEKWQVEREELGARVGQVEAQAEEKEQEREGERQREGERMREMEEQVLQLQERQAQLVEDNTSLQSQLEEERERHRQEEASLQSQLSAAEEQIGTQQADVQHTRDRVEQLEAYLGGDLPEEGRGVTWREERESLLARIAGNEEERRRLQTESQLLNIRLSSVTEILSLQEAEMAKESAHPAEGGGDGGGSSLLSRWREKVFVLMVQSKLQLMEQSRMRQEAQRRETDLLGQVSQVERERELLSHTLTDRTAQLQLQLSKTEEMQCSLDHAQTTLQEKQSHTDLLTALLRQTTHRLSSTVERFGQLKSTTDVCLSRLANYEQRVAVMSRRVNSLRVSLGCRLALEGERAGGGRAGRRTEVGTQTELPEKTQDLTSLSQGQLMEEVGILMSERDTLAAQLSASTAAFQQQLQQLRQSEVALEQSCSQLQSDKSSMAEELRRKREDVERSERERAQLEEGRRELEEELRNTQATLQSRVDMAVLEERQRAQQEVNEVQQLLDVARREHAKAVVQLQQLERKLGGEKDRAVEAVELARQQVEEELQRCQERLRAVQVERNLLLTSLRQEGIRVPPKQPPPRTMRPQGNSPHPSSPDGPSLTCSSQEDSSQSPSPPLSQHLTSSDDEGEKESECGDSLPTAAETSPLLGLGRSQAVHNDEEDIHCVLKELQLLSTSLLEMKTQS